MVDGRTTIGARNRIFPFASVGAMPQDLKYRGEPSTLDDRRRQHRARVRLAQPGTEGGGMVTRDRQRLPVHGVLARRARLPPRRPVILANGVALGGHVTVENYAIVGGLARRAQFVRLGESSLCAAGAMVSKDVPPFCIVAGDRARLFGLNIVGLRRRGFSADDDPCAAARLPACSSTAAGSRREHVAQVRAELGTVPEVEQLRRLRRGVAAGHLSLA